MFCSKCGKEVKPGIKFCDGCGYPVKTTPEQQNEPIFTPAPAPVVPEENRPLGPWAYFGYGLLFSLPFVGFILLIVFSFAGRNVNRKNFARSYWCGLILLLAFALIFVVLVLTGVLRGTAQGVTQWIQSLRL